MASVVAASTAAVVGVSMYLEGSLHIWKDLKSILNRTRSSKKFHSMIQQHGISIWPFFALQVEKLANTECIWSRTGSYTWKETQIAACQYAHFLLSLGLKPGDTYAVYLQNSPEFIFSFLAGWAIGCIPALINSNLTSDSLLHCLKVSKAKILLVDGDDECVARIASVQDRLQDELGVQIIILNAATRRVISTKEPLQPDRESWSGNSNTTPISLIFTSGSTGRPKAVGSPLMNAWALGEYRLKAFGLKAGPKGDRWYICMPLYHGTGLSTVINSLLCGMTICIGKKFSVSRFWSEVRDSRATCFVYVGETVRYLVNTPPQQTDKQHNIRLIFGNGLRPEVWTRFTERFGVDTVVEIFNSTEGVFTLANVARGPYLTAAVGHHGALTRFGMRNLFIPVEIDYETGNIWRDPKTGFARRQPHEVGGEIIVRIQNEDAFVGYWGDEAATQKKFERDVFTKGDLYYRTGDALRRSPDGRWFFMDRLGDTFRWKSENVATAEVAEVLGQFPSIVEASVYGVQVPGHEGRAGCAAVYIQPGQRDQFDYQALKAHCESKLPQYAVPIFIRVLREITPMHNNKQNKLPLKKDGIDLTTISEAARRIGKHPDRILWRPEALNMGRRSGFEVPAGFVDFTFEDKAGLDQLVSKL